MRPLVSLRDIGPGLLLCGAIALAAVGLERLEVLAFGRAWIDGLVLAILLGAAVRSAWEPGERWRQGIGISAKLLLEIAVVLLGGSLSAAAIVAAGPALLAAIAAIVLAAIAASFAIGRLLGLPPRLAMLVACGNSICGNSAIAAVAPVIGARGRDVAAAIAFTAVLGVAVVLVLPLIGEALGLSELGYGALAGLTVYAVPQVVAAAAPMGALAIQFGTLVKLVRVLMLGPVCILLSLLAPRFRDEGEGRAADGKRRAGLPPLGRMVPWFVLGFMAMLALRSAGLIPEPAIEPLASAATILFLVAMAALGLGVDVRTVGKAGGRVTATVLLALLALGAASLLTIGLLGL